MGKLIDIRQKLDLLIFAVRFLGTMGIYLFIAIVILLVYWNLEPDPLKITDTGRNPEIATCKDRVFTFERRIVTTKYLEVYVSQEMIHLESGTTLTLPAIPPYSGAASDKVVTYPKVVPTFFMPGLYEYVPTLTYKVNPIRTITKTGPSQKVLVCEASND